MAATLAEMRATLRAQEDKKTNSGSSRGDGLTYPHWNINEGADASLRFIPDADQNNPFFWAEKLMIKLPFSGIVGQADSRPVTVQVPCVEMYGSNHICPILAEVRPWYKIDEAHKLLANKYWKKRSYIFQGFVRKDPLKEAPLENPIRKFVLTAQPFALVKAALLDPEFNNLPTDYADGVDFKMVKTSKGGHADYSTSNWSRGSSALSQAERTAIETFGLVDLKSYLPKMPGPAELAIMTEMFRASVDGQAYDMEKWGGFFKPYGAFVNAATAAGDTEEAFETPRQPSNGGVMGDRSPQHESAPAQPNVLPTPTATPSSAPAQNDRANDILAMIRNRPKT